MKDSSLESGMNEFLIKPLTEQSLKHVMDRFVF